MRLSDFLQQKRRVAPLVWVIPHSRPPVVHVIRGEENNRLHNGKPELMSSIVPPCCGCIPGQLHSVGTVGLEYPDGCAVCKLMWISGVFSVTLSHMALRNMWQSLKISKMDLEEGWKVITRSAVSHGAAGRPLGSVAQRWESLLLCHRYTDRCQGRPFLSALAKNPLSSPHAQVIFWTATCLWRGIFLHIPSAI